MKTREKITNKALELFNQNGIEYVGMRELAAALDMKIGNITYYFPTKDDLVNQLALDLSDLNAKTLGKEDITMESFLEMRVRNFQNQYMYRGLLLSFVHIMKQNPMVAERYKNIGKQRGDGLRLNIRILQKKGFLKLKSAADLEYLSSLIGLIARFWISEAAISNNNMSVDKQIRHYVELITKIFIPFTTKSGKNQIDQFFKR
jgi:AcrR family transcriptional regulator